MRYVLKLLEKTIFSPFKESSPVTGCIKGAF